MAIEHGFSAYTFDNIGYKRAIFSLLVLSFFTTCLDYSKPYMILKALDESYKTHIGFAISRASGEEQQPTTSSHVCATVLSSGPERVN